MNSTTDNVSKELAELWPGCPYCGDVLTFRPIAGMTVSPRALLPDAPMINCQLYACGRCSEREYGSHGSKGLSTYYELDGRWHGSRQNIKHYTQCGKVRRLWRRMQR